MNALEMFEEPSDLRLTARLLSLIDSGTLVAERSGRILFIDRELRRFLSGSQEPKNEAIFLEELIGTPLDGILREIESGAAEVGVQLSGAEGNIPARVRWLRQPDWLIVTMGGAVPDVVGVDKTSSPGKTAKEAPHNRNENGRNGPAPRLPDLCQDWVTEDLVFLAASRSMAKIREQILRVAAVNVPIFLWGESGTGKEVLARMVHAYSKRNHHPFVKVNCAALPSELLESELFGYEQGAFTGAVRSKPGKFEAANHGTLFLDEIAEMSSHLQSKLLHALQDGKYSRLGGRNLVQTDVRVIAATNVDVDEAIQQRRFREDLYYRLNVVTIHIPPLRDRPQDIPPLLRNALTKYQQEFGQEVTEPPPSLIDLAMAHPWPGNVRELENFAKRYVILGDAEESLKELRKDKDKQGSLFTPSAESEEPQTLKRLVRGLKDEAEARAIAEALKQTRWCRKDAARMLGISYKALLYKIRQLGLDPTTHKEEGNGAERARVQKVGG